MTNRLLYVLVLFLLLGLAYSCSDEREGYGLSGGAKEKLVSFSVRVPGAGSPNTYALTETDENTVKNIVILLFDGSGNYTYQPIYCNKISTDPTDSKIKTFSAKVPEGTYNHMLVLANANKAVSDAMTAGNLNIGDSKNTVINNLLLSNSGKWESSSSSAGYVDIPMWGEISPITISSSMPASNPVTLVRMVSKIDVNLGTSAQNTFKLKSVRLYNYNDQGQIAPDATNWNALSKEVSAPSVPASASKPTNPETKPLVYDGTAITTTDVACVNQIYTFEATAGSDAGLTNNTCLVIGGYYGTDTKETFYRVDFSNTNASTNVVTYLALLRNHHYKVFVKEVSGPGLATDVDAFRSRPVNIKASIMQWSDGRFTEFAVNDQYLLGLSKSKFEFTREKRDASSIDNILSVITDYASGWKIDKIVDANGSTVSWLKCTPMSGNNPAGDDISLLVDENKDGVLRTAYIHLTAERLTYIVKVDQDIITDVGIYLTDIAGKEINTLTFNAAKDVQPAIQQFKMTWSPKANDVFISSSAVTNAFTFASGSDVISNGSVSDPNGIKTFSIQPPAITTANLNSDPFYECTSVVLYTVTDGVTPATKTLMLRQFVYNMVPVVEPHYMMDGLRKSIGVRSNSDFAVKVKNNSKNVITLRTMGGAANTSTAGTPVYFDIIDDLSDPQIYTDDVELTIYSPNNLFPDTDITLRCLSGFIQPKSNSYIVAPNSVPILIPVDRANDSDLGVQLGASESYTAELVWTDNANGIAANSNIRMIKAAGKGSSGYLLVMPGSAEGNAVVAIKDASDKILWSWHIWVTDYTPSGTWMDRNLGAIGNTPGEVGTLGLLYQWGRKDPFPGASTINGTTESTIYDAQGTTTIAKTQVSVDNNLANAIAKPATFYTNSQVHGGDWYTNDYQIINNDLWVPGTKTVYDPCPLGYRIASLNDDNDYWERINDSTLPYDPTTNGRYDQNNTLGFIPCVRARRGHTSALEYLPDGTGAKKNAGYHTCRIEWGYTYSGLWHMHPTGVFTSWPSSYRSWGLPVRCISE